MGDFKGLPSWAQVASTDVNLYWVAAFPAGAQSSMPTSACSVMCDTLSCNEAHDKATWMSAAGALRPNQTVNVSLEYDPTQVPGQGRYDTSVLVTMSEQPYAKARPSSTIDVPACLQGLHLQLLCPRIMSNAKYMGGSAHRCLLCPGRRMQRRCCSSAQS